MNQTPNEMPPYDHFAQLLKAIELDAGASEIQGVIAGLLCAGHSDAHANWFAELFAHHADDDLLVKETRQLLGQVYLATRNQLSDMNLDFSPYLPGDGHSLVDRAKCLSEWCQGFLYGLGLAGVDYKRLTGEIKEALHDIAEFTKLDYQAIESDDASEAAYMQLHEFLRVAILLIWEDLSSIRDTANESD